MGESKFEFSREYTLPDGVKPEEVTCKYLADGRLTIEAPCTAPALPASADKDIPVKHE
ncbi:unnamed protein product [Soboliphyme baturini]|uniref:SHSP domain-containing protein n=1 Tax=Soboliphyme baturini TaxID=241478 RepID=A0A183J6N9_9BILA|nr:unnamed protein product [Soboliphyme baturini]